MEQRFYLSQTDRKISGVCGGLAEYFDVDSVLVRVALIVFTLCGGCGIIVYILLALLAPKNPNGPQNFNSTNDNIHCGGSYSNKDSYNSHPTRDLSGSHYDKG